MTNGAKPYAQAPCGAGAIEGFPIAVAVMHRMYQSSDEAGAAHSFASKLQDAWAVGDPACDNGVVVLLSVFENQLVMATGAGVDKLVPPEIRANILTAARAEMSEGRYGAAVEQAADGMGLALAAALQPRPSPAPHDDDDDDDPHDHPGQGGGDGHFHWVLWVEEVLVVCGVVSATVSALVARRRRQARAQRQYRDCRDCLSSIQRDNRAALRAEGSASAATTCPLCSASFHPDGSASEPHITVDVEATGAGASGERRLSESSGRCRTISETGGSDVTDLDDLRQPLNPAGGAASYALTPMSLRSALMLPCGHAFCEPCIARRLDRGESTCPVCSQPVSDPGLSPSNGQPGPGDGALVSVWSGGATGASPLLPTPGAAPSSSASASASTKAPLGGDRPALLERLRQMFVARSGMRQQSGDVVRPELAFRVQQLARQFPQYVSREMAAAWDRDVWAGRDLDSHQLRVFDQRDPQRRGDGLAGSWPLLRRAASQMRGLRLFRARR